jgi:hypothetical protein
MEIRALLFVVILLISNIKSLAQVGFTILDRKKKVTIPFERYNNLILVPVTVNGKIPLKFLLDTGVRTAILTERVVADILNLNFDRKISIFGATGGIGVDAYITSNVSIELPGVKGRGHALLVLGQDFLMLSKNMGLPVHGIIGYELFSRFVVELDYDNNQITLYEPAHFKPKRSFKSFPIKVKDTKPYLDLQIKLAGQDDYKDVHLMMDTGASTSVILGADSIKNIEIPQVVIESNLGRGIDGVIQGFMGRIDRVKIGNFEFKDVLASFPTDPGYLTVLKETKRNGSLGSGVMSKFTIIFDYIHEKVYIKKNNSYKTPFEFNMSGIEVLAEGRNFSEFRIYSVITESPAYKAGLREGDIIIKINSRNSANLTLNAIYNIFSSKPGKKLRVKAKRENEVFYTTFILEQLI